MTTGKDSTKDTLGQMDKAPARQIGTPPAKKRARRKVRAMRNRPWQKKICRAARMASAVIGFNARCA